MAEIIPSLTREVLSRMTPGEKRLARRIRELLEDDYLCWYDIPVGKKQRYPDFILLHPARGLLFLEVKDWKPETIKKINKERVELLTPEGRKIVPNPFVQVRQCTYQAIKFLEADPLLQQQRSDHKGKLITPYAWGVVFANITRHQINTAIPEEQRVNLLPDHRTIYKDEMTESADAEQFQERLWGMFEYQFRGSLTLPQIDRIRWHLFPEMRIDAPVQEGLFEEDSAGEVSEPAVNTLPDIVRIMDIQQEQLARSLGEGHRIIHGVAGSGKTLILGFRAQMLAQTSSKPILILCFNVSLAAKLRSLIAAKNLQQQVQVYHFHDWCGVQLKTYQVDVVGGDAPMWERQVDSVIGAVESKRIPGAQYGALLIDEGHDFEAKWLKLITQMIDPSTNSLLLLYDDAQSIYKKDKGLGFTLSSVGIQAQGRTTILRLNYRNTREILDFSYRFVRDYLRSDSELNRQEDDFSVLEPEAAGNTGPKPNVYVLPNLQAEIKASMECIRVWIGDGVRWGDIAVIYVAGHQGKLMANALKDAGMPHLWMASKLYKNAYDPTKNKVTVLTLKSSKGLEFSHVLMLGLGTLNQQKDQAVNDAKLLYVGMTRAQRELAICVSGQSDLCKKVIAAAG